MLTYHTAIIGAGASGLFCAGSFVQSKILLDHNKRPGMKLSISGGGKCNFTNLNVSSADYLCKQKHFCKNALAAFKPQNFISLLDQEHIPYQTLAKGQLFAQSAKDLVSFLTRRAKKAATDFALETEVLSVQPNEDGFLLHTSAGSIQAKHVVLACGGLSYPKLGACSFGTKIARQFELNVVEQRPALCGLYVQKPLKQLCKSLTGNSTPVTVTVGEHTITDSLLFTHEGLSGPAILDASLFWKEGQAITINFLPSTNLRALLALHKQENKPISSFLPLTGHIAQTLLGANNIPLANATKAQLENVIRLLTGFTFVPSSTAGYTKAEVTAGGIDTRELNPSTFEIKKVPGLYAIGEVLDVTGRVGGYNLHWAWACAYCAAKHLTKK